MSVSIKAKKDIIGLPEIGITDSCMLPDMVWVLGPELGSSERAARALHL